MRSSIVPFLVAAVMFALPAGASAVEMSDSSCYECHDELKQAYAKGTVHQPVIDGECDSCHEDHGDEEKLMLVQEGADLCLECHDKFEGSSIHEPVAEGSCLDCHEVHHSENASLLTSDPGELCGDCHDKFEGISTHEPVAEGNCLDCHLAHSSKNAALLTAESGELCGECHSDMDHSEGKYPHEPVADSECSECHSPHASGTKPLLVADYLTVRYAMYSSEAYALCFNCHDKEPFETKDPEGTEFRNGSVNLHNLHLVKEEVSKYGVRKVKEGMTCMGCHVSHGTNQPKLIRYNLECGDTYCYTLNYRRFEEGGSCVVGCHKPKTYKKSELVPAPPVPIEPQPLASKEAPAKSPLP